MKYIDSKIKEIHAHYKEAKRLDEIKKKRDEELSEHYLDYKPKK